MSSHSERPILAFSHLRWDFVFQRPQQVLSRFARTRQIYYVEEPVYGGDSSATYIEERAASNVTVLRPHLPNMSSHESDLAQKRLLESYLARHDIADAVLWYFTPMPMGFTAGLDAAACVYDCMDELSGFAFAPEALKPRERDLLRRADVVFTGGRSLYYSKRALHDNVHLLPSSVDAEHFRPRPLAEPAGLSGIPSPRFGFYGVIDERFDAAYVEQVAALRPDWHFVLLGPVVKIDPASLPRGSNIHYLGQRSYDTLPAYLHHWDIAMLPFALNASTRYISPTKTLEYLAARKPVISTPIADVVDPYGEQQMVAIAPSPDRFVALADSLLREPPPSEWHARIDRMLAEQSWDATVARMSAEIDRVFLLQSIA